MIFHYYWYILRRTLFCVFYRRVFLFVLTSAYCLFSFCSHVCLSSCIFFCSYDLFSIFPVRLFSFLLIGMSFCLSCLFIMSFCLFSSHLLIILSFCLSSHLLMISLCVCCLFGFPPICLSLIFHVCLLSCLFVCPPLCLSPFLFVWPPICLLGGSAYMPCQKSAVP